MLITSRTLTRTAFTLTEVLVATLILMIMSTVMLGALFTATRLYEQGERAKNTNDEAMIVFASLQRDFSAQVPPADSGEFLAELQGPHNCLLGFTIRDPTSSNRRKTSFVEWYVSDATLYRRARRELGGPVTSPAQPISANILHFGVYAATASDALPDDHTWWSMQQLSDLPGESPLTLPTANDSVEHDDNDGIRGYPHAVRVHLIVAGGKRVNRTLRAGTVNEENTIQFSGQGRLNRRLSAGEYEAIDATGAGAFAAGPGSVAVIGEGSQQEIVGYHALDGGDLVLNGNGKNLPRFVPQDAVAFDPGNPPAFDATQQALWQQGPLGVRENANRRQLTGGRGLFRSPIGDHDRNEPIRYGTLFTMNRVLLR